MTPPRGPHQSEGFRHATLRSVILPRYKVLLVPMPKAGCTTLLWTMASIAGYRPEHFLASSGRAVSREMTIHDMARWRRRNRWSDLPDEQRAMIGQDEGWLRFTTVREPARRLWSAWQSKLLFREPAIGGRFADRPWFPRIPEQPGDVVEDFRHFVRSLAASSPEQPVDVHWAPQTEILASAPPLNHVGRVEAMDETMAVLDKKVGATSKPRAALRENSSLLPFDAGLLDDECTRIVNDFYARDFIELAYPPLERSSGDLDGWLSRAEVVLPAVQGYISRHERISVLNGIVARSKAAGLHGGGGSSRR